MKNEEQLDKWLDQGLAQYGFAEPRAGLESRILANLNAQRIHLAARRRWWNILTAVSAAGVFLLAICLGYRAERPQHAVPEQTAPTAQSRERISDQPTPWAGHRPGRGIGLLAAASRSGRIQASAARANPKLDQFPSPKPLSAQEKLLLAYVKETPRDEVIAVASRPKVVSSLEIKDLEVPPLDRENPASESGQTN